MILAAFPTIVPAESGMLVIRVIEPVTPQEREWSQHPMPIWRVCLWVDGRLWFCNRRGPLPTLEQALMELACAPRAWVEIIRTPTS